jgi:hypothetical protein
MAVIVGALDEAFDLVADVAFGVVKSGVDRGGAATVAW